MPAKAKTIEPARATSAAIIENAKRLLATTSVTAEDISAAHADIAPAVDAADAALADLGNRRRQVLLVGTDAELAEIDASILAQNRTKDRLTALGDALEEKCEEMRRNSDRANALARRAAAEKRRDAAAAVLRKRWPELAREIVDILGQINAAETDIEAFNRFRDTLEDDFGLDRLEGVEEIVRKRPGQPEKIIDTQYVERFITDRGGVFSGSMKDAKRDPETGGFRVKRCNDFGQVLEELLVFKRRFRVETYVPRAAAVLPAPLWETVNLPGLVAGDRPFWTIPDPRSMRLRCSFEEVAHDLASLPECSVDPVETRTREILVANEGGE